MNATLLYRIAAVVFVLFAIGHTFGFLRFSPATADALAVKQAMVNVRFQIGGGSFSYGGFYRGFGLYVSVYLLFAAFLSWHLGTLARTHPDAIGALGWMFLLVQVAGVALSWMYFGKPPLLLSVIVAVCVGWAAWLVPATKM